MFPLWGRDPADHAAEILRAGLKARACSVETDRLPADRAGCRFDEDFVARLPRGVDPCGENGEFHTFVEWAPGWPSRVPTVSGGRIECYGFGFAEIEESARQPKEEAARHPTAGQRPVRLLRQASAGSRARRSASQGASRPDHTGARRGDECRGVREVLSRSHRAVTPRLWWSVVASSEPSSPSATTTNRSVEWPRPSVSALNERSAGCSQGRFGCTPSRFRSEVRGGRG